MEQLAHGIWQAVIRAYLPRWLPSADALIPITQETQNICRFGHFMRQMIRKFMSAKRHNWVAESIWQAAADLVDALRTEGSELVRYTEYTSGAEELAERVMQSTEPWDWLFEQDRKKVIWITFIRPGLYRLDDWFMASAYLIEGEKKALLIDTTMTHAHVDEVVKRITRLPVELAITHPHRDHMLHAFEFEKVYIHEDDRKAMYDCIHGMYDMKAGKVPQRPQTNTYPEYMDQLDHFHQVVGLKDGDVIDLGGTTIEMMYLGGHTQHDVVFADHTHRCLFTGDAVGSGYVVGVRYEKNRFHETYAWYRDNLERFIGRMKGKEDYTCFAGHFIQENSAWMRCRRII